MDAGQMNSLTSWSELYSSKAFEHLPNEIIYSKIRENPYLTEIDTRNRIVHINLDSYGGGLAPLSSNFELSHGKVSNSREVFMLEEILGKSFTVDAVSGDAQGKWLWNLQSRITNWNNDIMVPQMNAIIMSKWVKNALGYTEGGTPIPPKAIDNVSTTDITKENIFIKLHAALLVMRAKRGNLSGLTILLNQKHDLRMMYNNMATQRPLYSMDISNEFDKMMGVPIVYVPENIFYTDVNLSTTANSGFTTAGDDVNFMIVHYTSVWWKITNYLLRSFDADFTLGSNNAYGYMTKVVLDYGAGMVSYNADKGIWLDTSGATAPGKGNETISAKMQGSRLNILDNLPSLPPADTTKASTSTKEKPV